MSIQDFLAKHGYSIVDDNTKFVKRHSYPGIAYFEMGYTETYIPAEELIGCTVETFKAKALKNKWIDEDHDAA